MTEDSLLPVLDTAVVLERGISLWGELLGARIFITGGTGFVGRWVTGALAAADKVMGLGLRVVVLSRGTDYFREMESRVAGSCVRFHRGDIRSFDFPDSDFDLVIHAAAESTRSISDQETRETIVGGTARCLEFATNRAVRRFLFLSSGAVYGRQPSAISNLPEDFSTEVEPEGLTQYGSAKREAERLVLGASAIHATIARGFAFVGPHLALDRHFAVGNFIRDALRGGPIVVRGDGASLRSYLYAADLAIWLLTILLRGRPGTAYNVGADDSISIGDLARLVADVVCAEAAVEIRQAPSGEPPPRYIPSTERARSELGLRVWTPLPEAIQRTANWYSSRREGP